MPPAFSIAEANDPDAELEDRFRKALTGYEDNEDELPKAEFDQVLKTAKSSIYTNIGADDFYSDHYLSEALLYVTAIKAKIKVENYSVTSWSVGDEHIVVRDADQEDSSQMRDWNDEANRNLDKSDQVDFDSGLNWESTANYNW